MSEPRSFLAPQPPHVSQALLRARQLAQHSYTQGLRWGIAIGVSVTACTLALIGCLVVVVTNALGVPAC